MPKQPPKNSNSPAQLSVKALRAQRLQAQLLVPRAPKTAIVDVVKTLCGVQAQLPSAMELALRARIEGLTIDDVEASRVRDRDVVRTWCMRGTMHLLAADDLDAMLGAITPAIMREGWRWFERRHQIDRETTSQLLDEAYRLLKTNGAMTRPDLLRAVGERFSEKVEAAAFGVVRINAMMGRICLGADDGAEATYVTLENWLGRGVTLLEADYVELARRYLRGYGAATARDFAEWWGLSLSEAKKAFAALEHELTAFDVDGETVWSLDAEITEHDGAQSVRLLPAFDTYMLGYANRDVAVAKEHQPQIFRDGQTAPVVVVDGVAAGTWRYERRGKLFRVNVEAFEGFTADVRALVAAEADDVARFYGLGVDLKFSS